MTKVTILDWAYPVGRNSKGQFVSLKNVKCNGGVDPEVVAETPVETVTPAPEVEAKSPKAPKAPKGPVVEITEAIYGAEANTTNVTDVVKVGRKVSNKNLGGVDPAPKVKKTLSVKALIDGSPIEKIFQEGEKVVF